MEKLGTYKDRSVYEVTRAEYVEKELYDDEYRYFVIKDDLVVGSNHSYFKSMVFRDMLVALVSRDNSKVEPTQARPYIHPYADSKEVKQEDTKVVENEVVVKYEVETMPVDEFLRAPQSVDEYLKEMKEIMYYEVEKV
jgi:purine-nucleoside phosphorylase